MIRISPAKDESTYVVVVSFEDHLKQPLIPNTVEWSLFDGLGVIVNERERISVDPAAEVHIVLFGPDLDADGGTRAHATRKLYVRATYSAIIDGVEYPELPVTDAAEFFIEDLPEPPVEVTP